MLIANGFKKQMSDKDKHTSLLHHDINKHGKKLYT